VGFELLLSTRNMCAIILAAGARGPVSPRVRDERFGFRLEKWAVKYENARERGGFCVLPWAQSRRIIHARVEKIERGFGEAYYKRNTK
jgi:hypothetical protein